MNELDHWAGTEFAVERFVRAPSLYAYESGDYLRPATPDELAESTDAAEHDGGAGIIRVYGRRCYVLA